MSNARLIESRAARWLARRESDSWSDKDQKALERWLNEGFANKAAFWRLEEGWRRADRVAALGLAPQYDGGFKHRINQVWKPLAIAASLALVTLAGVTQLTHQPVNLPGEQIETKVGGHKVVQLADGSSIELNTATVVRAAVTGEHREVWLENGEAFFDVRHSDQVPFVVHAGPKTVTVIGTKFSVRRESNKITVAVLQGRVSVTEAQPTDRSAATLVPAGSIAISEANATLVTEDAPVSVQSEMAWRHGLLIFRNDTLAEVAAEFNRYNERKIRVDGDVAQLKIGGSFKASNVDGFSRLLRDAYGLNVATTDAEVRVTD